MKFTGTYADVKEHAANFATYKQTTKRAWVTEKQDLATLLGNVQTKLKTYKLRPYVPPSGLALSVRNMRGISQIRAHASIGHRTSVGNPFSFRSPTIKGDQRTDTRVRSSENLVVKVTHSYDRIQETLRKKFAALTDGFRERLRAVSLELSAVEGPLEEQQRQIESIQTRIPALSEALETVEAAEAECVAAKVEENDYTVFTCQDLEFELELVVQSIAKKISFIDNQVCSAYFASFCF